MSRLTTVVVALLLVSCWTSCSGRTVRRMIDDARALEDVGKLLPRVYEVAQEYREQQRTLWAEVEQVERENRQRYAAKKAAFCEACDPKEAMDVKPYYDVPYQAQQETYILSAFDDNDKACVPQQLDKAFNVDKCREICGKPEASVKALFDRMAGCPE